MLRAVVLTQYWRVTDRRTDRRTDGIAIASTALASEHCARCKKRVVTEVVLFSVIAFKTLDISQSCVMCSDTLGVWWDL